MSDNSVYQRLCRYFSVVFWVLKWLLSKNKRKLIICVASGGANLLLQGVIIVSILYGLNNIDSSISLPYAIYDIDLTEINDLIIAGGILFSLLVLVALTNMYYQRVANNLSVTYEKNIITRLLTHYRKTKNTLNTSLLRGGSRLCGRSLRELMMSMLDLARLVVFLGVCLYMLPLLTMTTLFAISPFYVLHAVLNMRIHENQMLYLKYNQQVKQDLDNIKESVEKSVSLNVSEEVDSAKSLRGLLECYRYRINSVVSAQLISDMALAFAVSLIILWLIFAYLDNQVEVGTIVAYVFALRLLMLAGKGVSVSFAVFSKHYGAVRDVKVYLDE